MMLKLRRVVGISLALLLAGSITVLANDVYDWYKARKVQVKVNGANISSSALLLQGEGRTMLPLREITSTLQGMVAWNAEEQTVEIYKPNVHLTMFTADDKPFGKVDRGVSADFRILTQIDSLYNKISDIKITIEDPFGKDVYSYESNIQDENMKETLWLDLKNIKMNFKYVGKYTVKCYLKPVGANQYSLVSQKVISSVAK